MNSDKLLNPEIRDHILDCLGEYFDHTYDGGPLGGWVWGFIAAIAIDDGVKYAQDYLPHVEALLNGEEK